MNNDDKNNKNINKDIDKRIKIVSKNIENGYYLSRLRDKLGLRLIDVADKLDLNSATSLSDIERGKKVPNEELIKGLSLIYGVDEVKLSIRYGKISFTVLEGLIRDEGLHRKVWEMVKKKDELGKRG